MKTFDIYYHPAKGYEAVKQGFSWSAFLFSTIWAFVKRLWLIGFVLFGISSIIYMFEASAAVLVLIQEDEGIPHDGGDGFILLMCAIDLAFHWYLGAKANNWRRYNLIRRGFTKMETVQGQSVDVAISEAVQSKG